MSVVKNKKKKALSRAAGKATRLHLHIGASKFTQKGLHKHQERKMGKLGAASECRVIMKDGVIQ